MFTQHPDDPRIAITNHRADFIKAAKNPDFHGAIYTRTAATGNTSAPPTAPDDIAHVLRTMGYTDLIQCAAYSLHITTTPKENGEYAVHIEKQMPPALHALIENRAKLMAEITGFSALRLTMGNIRHEKMHAHITPTMTGSLINLGTQWEIYGLPANQNGQVGQGQDFFMRPYLKHRSYPVSQGEERFAWALTTHIL